VKRSERADPSADMNLDILAEVRHKIAPTFVRGVRRVVKAVREGGAAS